MQQSGCTLTTCGCLPVHGRRWGRPIAERSCNTPFWGLGTVFWVLRSGSWLFQVGVTAADFPSRNFQAVHGGEDDRVEVEKEHLLEERARGLPRLAAPL